jgi:hypothetical protein
MPTHTVVDIPQEAQAQMPAALRRARYDYLLARRILLLCAAGHTPTDIAAVLCCSRSSVYRTVRAYRAGTLGLEPDEDGRLCPPVRTTVLVPTLRRSLLARVLSRWHGTHLALALEATTLGLRFTVWAISVLYRGGAIPVAWTILLANQPHAWRREWRRLCATYGRRSLRAGPSSCWPTAACMLAGCFGVSSAWAGTPSCGSMGAVRSGPRVRRGFIHCSPSRHRWGATGAVQAPPSRTRSAA